MRRDFECPHCNMMMDRIVSCPDPWDSMREIGSCPHCSTPVAAGVHDVIAVAGRLCPHCSNPMIGDGRGSICDRCPACGKSPKDVGSGGEGNAKPDRVPGRAQLGMIRAAALESCGAVLPHNPEVYLSKVTAGVLSAMHRRSDVVPGFIFVEGGPRRLWTLADGTLIIPVGCLDRIDNEAEFVFFVAHEAAHWLRGHVSARVMASRPGILGSMEKMLLARRSTASQAARLVAAAVTGYGATREEEADREGVRILGQLGYDIGAALRLLSRCSSDSSHGLLHPPVRIRVQQMKLSTARQPLTDRPPRVNREVFQRALLSLRQQHLVPA